MRYPGMALLAGLDGLALAGLNPDWARLGSDLLAPRAWFDRVGPDGAAGELGAAALWCVALWLAVGLAAVAATVLPGWCGRVARRSAGWMLPAIMVRAVAGATGLAVLGGPATAALAAPSGAVPVATASPISAPHPTDAASVASAAPFRVAVTAAALDPAPAQTPPPVWPSDDGPLPCIPVGWPTTGPTPSTGPTPPTGARPPTTGPNQPDSAQPVIVQPGDSLWLIAARRLEPHASDTEIAANWPRWYQANREQIGADPNLVRPGQVLHAPSGPTSGTSR